MGPGLAVGRIGFEQHLCGSLMNCVVWHSTCGILLNTNHLYNNCIQRRCQRRRRWINIVQML